MRLRYGRDQIGGETVSSLKTELRGSMKFVIGALFALFAAVMPARLWFLAVADLPPWIANVKSVITSTANDRQSVLSTPCGH